MNKKYKTLLDLAKKVCEGVMNYYDSKDELEKQKIYMFLWEQVYLLAQLCSETIRYVETSKSDEASGKKFVTTDATVCMHSKDVVDSIGCMQECIHKAVETFLKKLVEHKIKVADEYAEAKMIRYVKALIAGNLNNAARQAENNGFKYSNPAQTLVFEERMKSDKDSKKEDIPTNASFLRDEKAEQEVEEAELLDDVILEFLDILYSHIENHPEDEIFIRERYLEVLEHHKKIKKGKEIAETMHISGAAISKKIAKYDAYFAQLLKERLKQWR